jgi:hypothetical protein
MITQQHENEIPQKAQAPSPVKQHRWRVALLSILGVVLPLVAGSIIGWPLGLGSWSITDVILVIVGSAVVSVAVGAFLLCFAFRTWWVAVFAGVAWYIGRILASVVRPLVEGGWPALQAYQAGFWPSEGVNVLSVLLVPLLIGMALGAGSALILISLKKRGISQQ